MHTPNDRREKRLEDQEIEIPKAKKKKITKLDKKKAAKERI